MERVKELLQYGVGFTLKVEGVEDPSQYGVGFILEVEKVEELLQYGVGFRPGVRQEGHGTDLGAS